MRGAREIVHYATALAWAGKKDNYLQYACRIDRSTLGSSSRIIAAYLAAGKILRVIDGLPEHIQHWLMYAYAAEPHTWRRDLLAEHMVGIMDSGQSIQRDQLLRLIRLAIDDLKIRHNSRRAIPIDVYLIEMDVDRREWRKKYHRFRDGAHVLLDAYDRIGLEKVAAVAEEISND